MAVKVQAAHGPLHRLHDAEKSRLLLLLLVGATPPAHAWAGGRRAVQALDPQRDGQHQATAVHHLHLHKAHQINKPACKGKMMMEGGKKKGNQKQKRQGEKKRKKKKKKDL